MSFKKKTYNEIVDSMLTELSVISSVSDTHIGSVSRSLMEAVAYELALLYEQMETTYENGFIDTASGKGLDLVTGILGLERKSSKYATGIVTFSRENPNEKVTIFRGTRVSTQSDDINEIKLFETTQTVELNTGELEVKVPIKAIVPGEGGMADFGMITEMEIPIIGIDNVINESPTTMGTERENDSEFRERARAFVRTRSSATSEAIRVVVLNLPGVRTVIVNEGPNGIAGEVDVIVDGLDLENEDTRDFKLVKNCVEKVRPAGIWVNIKPAVIIRLEIRVYIRLTGKDRAKVRLDELTSKIKDSLRQSVSSLNIGEDLVRNKLISELFRIQGVGYVDKIEFETKKFDISIGGLMEDTYERLDPSTSDIKVKKFERLELTDISVYTEGRPRVSSRVFIDVNVKVIFTSKHISIQKVREHLHSELQLHLNTLSKGEDIDYIRIRNIIANNKGIAELKDLTLTVFHEKTGLVVKDIEANVKMQKYEYARIRTININGV
jgi:uncharacterized phage protein gp47/JayE